MFERRITIRAAIAWTGAGWVQAPLGGRARTAAELEETPAEGLRQKKMMSHSAWRAYLALHQTLRRCEWGEDRTRVACFLGVGASGSTESELDRIVGASLEPGGAFSPARFGTDGLSACNPLFAFQLMNNFTLCHGSILERLGGPNAALYSRGVGTVAALAEACYAIDEGQTGHALAGGADTALHPVTHGELLASGRIREGLVPAEGAAYLALTDGGAGDFTVERVDFFGGGGRGDLARYFDQMRAASESRGDFFLAPWGAPARAVLETKLAGREYETLAPGESLAATPAVAWVTALERMAARGLKRGTVLSAGIDGGLGAVTFARRPA